MKLIDENGKMLGEMNLKDAINLARQKDLDVVKVGGDQNPPVCRLIDSGKYFYALSKKTKQDKKSKSTEIKEIRIGVNIEENDLNLKLNKAKSFLDVGYRVKISVYFKGRQILYPQHAVELMEKIKEKLNISPQVIPKRGKRDISILVSAKDIKSAG